jgi:acyl-CoA synthetase (AMP-forming)/AMP-acid ligase II
MAESGRPCALEGNVSTIPELLQLAAAHHPEREVFVDGTRRLSFGQLNHLADRLARALWKAGLRPGNVIALMLPSSIDYAVCYHAAMRIRAIASGINPRLGPVEISHIMDALRPAAVIHSDDVVPPSTGGVRIPRSQIAAYATADAFIPPIVPDPKDIVAVVWTGGTTGKPKGAMFDHRNLKAVALATTEISAPGDRRISAGPFSHVNYMTRCWDEISRLITTIISPQPWKATSTLECVVAERITVLQMVPTQWRLLLALPQIENADLSCVRLLYTGGSTVHADLIMQLKARFRCPVIVRYTCTEVAVGTGTSAADEISVAANTVGRPVAGVEVSLVDDFGSLVTSPGAVGRIRFRSAAVMRGYWNDPSATAQSLSADGWYTTGDLGWIDADNNMHFVGRSGDMYIRGGYNVYPIEVEDILLTNPAVAQAGVVGAPDPVLGEIGVAFVVVKRPIEAAELRDWCKSRLADYKAPDRIYFLEAFPHTSMDKVDKRVLARMAQKEISRPS